MSKKKIESLTDEQKSFLFKQKEKWLKIGLDTNPMDKELAVEGITEAYEQVNLKMPEQVYFVSSPLQGMALASKLMNKDKVECIWPGCYGQTDASWLSFYDTFLEFGIEACEKLKPHMKVAQAAHWWWPFDKAVIVCDRPERLVFDANQKLHCEDGPSVLYRDGFKLYSLGGIRITEKKYISWIEGKEQANVKSIQDESNLELRRVLIDFYGREKFLKDSGAKKIAEDDFGVLFHQKMSDESETLAFVKVVNSSPEPDGSFKDYYLRVPPTVKTAKEGVAWTMGEEESTYMPEIET